MNSNLTIYRGENKKFHYYRKIDDILSNFAYASFQLAVILEILFLILDYINFTVDMNRKIK